MKWSKPFRKDGNLQRWRIYKKPDGTMWKQLFYYHRKADKWVSTNKILKYRGRLN